jgi:6-pyruvoyl-tetrahydropterin synthase
MMGRILITERRGFAADHYHSLPNFCEPRHGHDWEVEATVAEGGRAHLGPLLGEWADGLDRSLLNEKEMLAGRNPTAEALAECLFRHIEAAGLAPVTVRAREKPGYWAAVRAPRPSVRFRLA